MKLFYSLLVYSLLASAALLSSCAKPGVEYAIEGDTIAEPLTAAKGRPQAGKEIFVARDAGHCVLCHRVDLLDAPFQGDVGPDLSNLGGRLTAGQIRLRIVDASALNPASVMPPYYRTEGLAQVGEEYRGRPALTAEEIEHLVAFLVSLDGEGA